MIELHPLPVSKYTVSFVRNDKKAPNSIGVKWGLQLIFLVNGNLFSKVLFLLIISKYGLSFSLVKKKLN